MTSVHAPQLPGDVHPLLNKYHAWVLENESFARRLENVLYVVPMLVPATLGNPDVVSEVGYSMGGLLKLYHDWVLYQVTPPSDEKTLTADNTSFSIVQAARVPLSIISQVQVAAEMISLKVGGKQSRWNVYISCEVRPQDAVAAADEYTGQRSGRVYRSTSSRPRETNLQPLTLSFLVCPKSQGFRR
ncbi:hypothetical protein DYB25_008485 [Aphanomyces astaci]|uniref:Peroxisomal membrane protein PEX16 n=2 Tax=Aphanomyces astaci TaxID=112090 RepID=A0A397AQH4_APHAT|nr:hypothetical protein DYB25_008485 [Aphanomyces astaci]